MQVSFIRSIHQVEPAHWNGLWASDYPFTRHAFLAALEDSGSTRAETGWQPHHALLRLDGKLVGAVPLFMKTHSYGEYVFDWTWADAYAQHQLNYYPKLVNAIPFTPSTGPRIALASHLDSSARTFAMHTLQTAIEKSVAGQSASSWHCLFPDTGSQHLLAGLPLIRRYGYQFHWFNQNYDTFEDFVGNFTSRKRKNLNKERRKVAEAGLDIRTRSGNDIAPREWDLFYALYHRTYLKRSGNYGYLGPGFFQALAQSMPEQLLLVSAHRAGANSTTDMLAAAFYLHDRDTLYGRYWGCLQEYNSLHFEACYYRGIEYAIAHKLNRFDPGAQGEHKIQRGFVPVKTCSYHWLADPRFAEAVSDYCERESLQIAHYIDKARRYLPFREEVALPPKGYLLAP